MPNPLTISMIRKAVSQLKSSSIQGDFIAPIRNWPLFFALHDAGCMGRMPDGFWTYSPEPKSWLCGKPVGGA